MNVVRYDQLFDQLRLRIPSGCEPGMMLVSLRNSARKFCLESLAWRENMDPITTVAGQLAYSIANPWSSDIARVVRVGLRTAEEIATDANASGTEIYCKGYSYIPSTNQIKFISAPASQAITNGMLVNAVLVPKFNADEIAEWFLNQYIEGILAGAVNDICLMPGKFYNPDAARRGSRSFNNEVCRANRDAQTGFNSKPYQIQGGYALI